jgi:hypothetical protein
MGNRRGARNPLTEAAPSDDVNPFYRQVDVSASKTFKCLAPVIEVESAHRDHVHIAFRARWTLGLRTLRQ